MNIYESAQLLYEESTQYDAADKILQNIRSRREDAVTHNISLQKTQNWVFSSRYNLNEAVRKPGIF